MSCQLSAFSYQPRLQTAIFITTVLIGCQRHTAVTAVDIRRQLQELPAGSSVETATQFLEARGIDHTDYIPATKAIHAMKKSQHDDYTDVAFEITLFFDREDKFLSASVKEVFTSR